MEFFEHFDHDERRKFPRIKYHCFLKIEDSENQEEVVLLTRIENISLGGVLVILKQGLELGKPITLSIELLSSGQSIRCQGEIAWCRRRPANADKKPSFYDVGIEFVNISDQDRSVIEDILSRKSSN